MFADPFGRQFPYLRLSLTEQCNFCCQYCLPGGYRKTAGPSFLSLSEIQNLTLAFIRLGVEKIRLTGGEPTLRRDLPELATKLSHMPGLKTLALTTNGYNLQERAGQFYNSGINALNVSIDSLDPHIFHKVTGHDKLAKILAGLETARKAGFEKIKINTVLLKGVNDESLPAFLEWIKRERLSIRFIELMQTGENLDYFRKYHVKAEHIQKQLIELGFSVCTRGYDDGPAVEFEHPDYAGKIGIIAPYSKDFCKTCNRLRVTARGELRLCLFGAYGYDLRPLVQDPGQGDELMEKILTLLNFKVEGHFLGQGVSGLTPHLASIGG